ncbi:hypothetical protein [Amycolatopsis sp. CA-230715]|uniref:hypothetical protein n=1 Tax=Amycolatopsis sp. CA-230715 TaxID=2745196 RepID=UPI001C3285FD|nr:hypothetical protein [Amycolatopsis sp. CA-230715]QWF80339.1 hypothetical protein HUW46_03759 [Amycolatopsis sp. CA-230715]
MSRHPNGRNPLRVARGTLLAASSAALAVSAHAFADGGLPDTALTVLLTLLIGWVATGLTDRTTGPLGAFAVLGAGQLVMHVVLSDLMDHGTSQVDGAVMTAAHVVATGIAAVLVATAESMLRTAVAALRLLLPTVWRPAPVPSGPVQATAARPSADCPHVGVVLRRVCARRGPPLPS